jgi:nucleotide-binding universal stress UspA family protein
MPLTYIAGYDGTDASRAAVEFAVELARAELAEVVVAQVRPFSAAQDTHDALLQEFDIAGIGRRVLLSGSPAQALHDLAIREGASLLSVGVTHHGPLGRLAPGSVGAKLLHGAPCSVATVPARSVTGPLRTIAVAYDAGPEARRALRCAERLAARLEAGLVLIGAYELPPFAGPALAASWDLGPEMRDAFAGELREAAAGIPGAEVRLLDGPAGPSIAAATQDGIDLLVAGSRGYGPVRSVLLGGTSHHLADHAHCPVLVVPRTAEREIDRTPQAA